MAQDWANIYLTQWNFIVEIRTTGADTQCLPHPINCALLFMHQALHVKRKPAFIYFLCQTILRECLPSFSQFILAVTAGVAKASVTIKAHWVDPSCLLQTFLTLLFETTFEEAKFSLQDIASSSSMLLASGACLKRVLSSFPYGIRSLHLNLPLWTFLTGWCFGKQNGVL